MAYNQNYDRRDCTSNPVNRTTNKCCADNNTHRIIYLKKQFKQRMLVNRDAHIPTGGK